MKSIFVLTTIFAASFASQVILPYSPLSQVRTQDVLGQYYYGYNDGLSVKQERRTFDGVTRGSYSYVDANGKLQTVDYVADPLNGFRVAGTNLPQPIPTSKPLIPTQIKDTPEVEAAKKQHFKAIEDAKKGIAAPITAPLVLPKPVEDTPEVKAAKELHFAAKKNAELLARQPELIVRDPYLISGNQFVQPINLGGWNLWNGYGAFNTLSPYSPLFDHRVASPFILRNW